MYTPSDVRGRRQGSQALHHIGGRQVPSSKHVHTGADNGPGYPFPGQLKPSRVIKYGIKEPQAALITGPRFSARTRSYSCLGPTQVQPTRPPYELDRHSCFWNDFYGIFENVDCPTLIHALSERDDLNVLSKNRFVSSGREVKLKLTRTGREADVVLSTDVTFAYISERDGASLETKRILRFECNPTSMSSKASAPDG